MSALVEVGDGFYNIRGQFRIGGVVDLGTHCSLVRRSSGRFVLLDSYRLDGELEDSVRALTGGGDAIEAVINLHPFHTVHVRKVAKMFPGARLYGTGRHHERFPELPWQPQLTEGPELADLFGDEFEFLVPPGVHFVPKKENLHFASVLALHRASRTLHVDDTLNWLPLPFGGRFGFHPTLAFVLQRRAGAARELDAWMNTLIEVCANVDRICTAHARLSPLTGSAAIVEQLRRAHDRAKPVLRKHEWRYG